MKYQPKIVLIFLIFCCLLPFTSLQAQRISTEENFAINRPGIVKVQIEFSATVYVNKVGMIEERFTRLVDSVKKLDTSGNLLSAEQKLNIVLATLSRNPLHYFRSTEDYFRQKHKVVEAGTGFFISGDGYVVTNCHVIDKDSAFIRRKFLLSTFHDVTETNINALQSSWGVLLNSGQRNILYNTFASVYTALSSLILIDVNKELYVLYRADLPNGDADIVRKPATLISKGVSAPGKDVAILKIEAGGNLPSLTLSKDSLPAVGAQVLVFGYPEPVSNNSFLAIETGIEPTLTTGIVSAVKRSVYNWPLIQVDASTSHGNSGGPVCNERGEVIGIISFGSIENSTGGLASGFNFAIPVSIVREFIDPAKIKTVPSEATLAFNEATRFFYNDYYHRAKSRFEDVEHLNSGYPQLHAYIARCKKKIAEGADKENLAFLYGASLIIVLAILISYLYFKRRRKYDGGK